MKQIERKKTVLVIDDQVSTLAMLFEFLKERGVSVVVSESGESGLKRADYVQPDLILLDVMMPGIDGFETCRQLKANERTRAIPVIFMTALHSMEKKVEGFEAGAIDYVTKPLQLDEVWARIKTHLTLSQLQRELQEKNRALEQEITERKQAEQARKESEERYRRLVEGAPDIVYSFSDTRGSVYISNRVEDILGYAPEFLYAHPWLWNQSIHPDDLDDIAKVVQRFAEGVPFDVEYRIKDSNGTWRWLRDRSIGRRMKEDETIIEGIATDITERKHAEQEIRALNAELEERVRQRTSELDAANKSLQDFIYVASHDLKTPLLGISHVAEWLVQDYAGAFDEQGQEMMNLLVERVTRMDNLINAILEYVKIGRVNHQTSDIDVKRLVRALLEKLKVPETMLITIEHNLPVISGYPPYIKQVFGHLLKNAVSYMDKANGRIVIGCREGDEFWEFFVRDNGPGIAAQYHEKIFQMFQTLHPKDEAEKIGAGLAIVKKIVEFYGGRIWVESAPGKGSTFFFTFHREEGMEEFL